MADNADILEQVLRGYMANLVKDEGFQAILAKVPPEQREDVKARLMTKAVEYDDEA